MKEELYIDVVSKTIISQLAESIAQLVGNSVSKEIKTVLLTKLPGVIGDKIAPLVNNARKSTQEATEKSENRILDQLKETQKHIFSNSEKADNALNNLESFIKTELIGIQDKLAGSLGEKHYDLHDKIIDSVQKLVQDLPEAKVDVEKLQSHSSKVIDALDIRIRDLENEKVELFSALNEATDSAENLWATSQKEIEGLNAEIVGFESEKADQELHITRNLARINVLTNQVEDFNNKLKESEVIVENAVEEKEAMESKLIVIQELWEKQKIRQETF